AYDTISGGDWLCDQDAVEAFVREAPEEMVRLEHWGCPWSREPDGHIAVRPFGGMKRERTWFAADKTGFHMLHTLFQTSLKYEPVRRYDECFVTKLLVDEGRCQGVVAIELATGTRAPRVAGSSTRTATAISETTTWASRSRSPCSGPWSWVPATGSPRPSSRSRRRGARSKDLTATTSTSTCATWGRR